MYKNKYEVLTSQFNNKNLNSPNDVTFNQNDHSVWFTDPPYGFMRRSEKGGFYPVLPFPITPANGHTPADMPYLDEASREKG